MKKIVALIALALTSVANATPVSIGTVTGSYTITNNGVTQAQVESFLGISSGVLDTLGSNATIGSAIKDTVFVNAGDIFSFNWKWTSDEGSNQGTFNDFSFVSLSLQGTSLLANTFTPDNTTGLFSWTATSAGLLTWGIGAMNAGDSIVDSSVTVSNINVTHTSQVPEPGSLALIGAAFVGLTAARRRFKAV